MNEDLECHIFVPPPAPALDDDDDETVSDMPAAEVAGEEWGRRRNNGIISILTIVFADTAVIIYLCLHSFGSL